MATTRSTVFTGVGGETSFDVPNFLIDQEAVYKNGLRLVRVVDYSVVNTDPQNLDVYSRIVLNSALGTGNILAVITDVIGPDKLDQILSELEAISVATYGSWLWDKRNSLLTMYNALGEEKFKFIVHDSAEEASRERRQDLEI